MNSIPLFLSQDHSCSYLENRMARSLFVYPSYKMSTSQYSQLIEKGFRRSGNLVYTPHCRTCSECIPVRVPIHTFKPSRIQRRIIRKNCDTRVVIKTADYEHTHYHLYMRYMKNRHNEGNMATSSPEDYINFLASEWCNTRFVEFHIGKQLAAVAVVDHLNNALSAVYTFFDPEFSSFSPGIYAVLWQIQQAEKQTMDYLYLGFWIEACHKMSYKNQFQPIQGYSNEKWWLL